MAGGRGEGKPLPQALGPQVPSPTPAPCWLLFYLQISLLAPILHDALNIFLDASSLHSLLFILKCSVLFPFLLQTSPENLKQLLCFLGEIPKGRLFQTSLRNKARCSPSSPLE